ncbi:hypothetical protein JTB14_027715 [Gonioctena quinquepunctata]|nr:hypothetical protein JTB14_027715 [Gonioctena quinquepunctata]
MRGSAPPVQVAWTAWGGRADPPSSTHCVPSDASSVISGSSCRSLGNSNIRMQSVTENCLLNSVTVPKIQRIDHGMVAHNNSFKLVSKFGALLPGRDIPNQKSDDLELLDDLNVLKKFIRCDTINCDNNDKKDHEMCHLSKVNPELCTNEINQCRDEVLPLRLRGGGESSLSTGTSGWGTPPSQQASNNNGNKTNGQQPPTSQSNNSGWGQPGTKPTGNSTMPPNSQPPTSSTLSQNNNGPTNNTKQQLEQLNSMREAIFSQDGWGGQHVNQDTSWDIPSSPEPPMKIDGSGGPPPWKPAVNNGTELWEANIRNGGQPPPQPQQKTPWGHTPSTNIGGTWGEDDDTDSSNVWTGVPSNQQQWGSGGNTNNGAMWGGPKKENDWGTGAANTGWGDPRSADPRQTVIDPREIRPELRDMRPGNSDAMRLLDPREQMRQMAGGDMRGDPRGITGRLNGAGAEAFWGQGTPHANSQPMHHHTKMPVAPGNTVGWDEPSPPSQRRNMPNYDDGTSLWGNPQQGGNMGRGNNTTGPPGMAQSRMKPDGSVWGHGRNGSWDEAGPTPAWDESGSWAKQKMPGPLWDETEWGHKQANKPQLTKEMVWNSKQFRMLVDMGHKKEDVENALRLREMNVEEALDLLSPLRNNRDGWGTRHDDHYDHPPFSCQRFPPGPGAQLSGFPPGANTPNLLNNMSNSGANNSLINNMPPAFVQKMLTQGGGSQGFGGSSVNAGRNLQPQSQPSTQQLRMLVQQIQMAVQAGYLNHQILNQPLGTSKTLVLLNQLLQQIKTLQQLNTQQTIATTHSINGKPNNTFMQCSVLITKTKQQIANLQNQIAAQQATYVKQQQHQSSMGPYDSFKANTMHDSINALQSNFADLGINKDPQLNQQQSRLTQWINKDKDDTNEFSRAPGSSSKPMTTSPNMNPLGLNPTDGPWSSGRTGDTGWPDSGTNDNSNDVKDAQWSTTTQPSLTDLVPEFEPGKPWKGNQIKSIEDDPSITPGSVVRSPLSIATIKDNELFSMNPAKSPPVTDGIQSLSLSSSTWSFNPASATSNAFTSPPSKLPTSKVALGELNPTTAVTSELWAAPKSSRGPPPGLSAKGGTLANGWSGNAMPWGGGQRSSGNWGGSSQWLLLRNLTAQIDGSTLRTLCLQHGPLLSFHLYLHQGFALAKYSSREEAIKAQTTLNNCVLGNTTILAENPTDWDANTLLQHVASQQSGSSGAWRGSSKQSTGADTWSTGWANNPSTANLWAAPQLDNSDPARGTPSSLNSYLPNDLLGGESM